MKKKGGRRFVLWKEKKSFARTDLLKKNLPLRRGGKEEVSFTGTGSERTHQKGGEEAEPYFGSSAKKRGQNCTKNGDIDAARSRAF